MHPSCAAQSSEMRLHGTCFTGANVAWPFLAILAQSTPVMVCPAPARAGAINRADGIA
jgi:hypothetical protein